MLATEVADASGRQSLTTIFIVINVTVVASDGAKIQLSRKQGKAIEVQNMPRNVDFGPNEAVWRDFSAKSLAIAMTWPEEKLLRFTQHAKFGNLTPDDQTLIWNKLQVKISQPTAAPPAPATPSAPAPPPVTTKLLRAPTALGLATESATAPSRPFIGGELRAAMARATIFWGMAIAVGTIILKILSGG